MADVYQPPPRLVVIGAVDTAEALYALAKQLGWRTIVAGEHQRASLPAGTADEKGYEVVERPYVTLELRGPNGKPLTLIGSWTPAPTSRRCR